MKIFNEDKTEELKNPDLSAGYLVDEKMFIAHHDKVEPKEEEGHYEVIAEYPNGGKDVAWIVDSPQIEGHEEYDEYEDIKIYIPYSDETIEENFVKNLRILREEECFSVVNRGILWYDKLSEEEKKELSSWYEAWLNVTETKTIPEKPLWLH